MPELNFNALIPQGPRSVMEGFNLGQEQRNQMLQQQQARQLNEIQLRNALREQQTAAAEQEAYKGAADLEDARKRLMAAGLGKQSVALQKQIDDQRTAKLTQAKTQVDLIKSTANQIFTNPQNAAQILTSFNQRTGIDISDDLAQLQQLGGNPEAIKQWAAGHVIEADKMLPKFQEVSTPGGGKQLGTVNPMTAAFTATTTMAPQMTPGERAVDARARERLAAETATGALTPASLDLAANVYLQTGQLPTGMGKSASGLRSQVMNRATELSGGKPAAEMASGIVDAKQDVAARGKAVKDFGTGKQGDAVRSFNTAIDHLDTLSKAAAALQNGDVRLFNTAGNAIAAATGQAAPTDFDSVKTMVGSEVAKALTGANMALKDREEIRESLSRSNSPAQLASAIRRTQELMGGQLGSLKLQYETSTGRKDFDKKLTSRSTEVVQSLHGGSPAPGAAPSAAVKISGDADYNKLPSGALFIGPDGQQRRKP